MSFLGFSVNAEGVCNGYSESLFKFPIPIEGNYELSAAGIRVYEKKLNLNISDTQVHNADKSNNYLDFFKKIKDRDYKSIFNLSEKSTFDGQKEAKNFVDMYWNKARKNKAQKI